MLKVRKFIFGSFCLILSWFALFLPGQAFGRHGERPIPELLELHKQYLQSGDDEEGMMVLYELGSAYRHLGMYELAAESFAKSKSLALAHNDQTRLGFATMALGGTYRDAGYPKLAIPLLDSGATILGELGDFYWMGQAYKGLGAAYSDLGDQENAIIAHRKALQAFIDLDKEYAVYGMYNNIGDYHLSIGNLDSAEYYLNLTRENSLDYSDYASYGYASGNLGLVYKERGDLKKALEYFREAKTMSEKAENWKLRSWILEELSETCYEMGRKSEGDSYLLEYYSLNEGLTSAEFRQKMEVNNIRQYFLEQNLELARSNEEKALLDEKRTFERAAFLVTLLLVSIITLIIIQTFQRKRNKEKAGKREAELRNKLMAQKNRHLAELVESKNQNLERFVRNLEQKRELIDVLRREIEEKTSKSLNGTTDSGEFLFEKKILTKQDWEEYKLLFSEVYPNFIQELSHKAPGLSEGDLRIAIFTFMGFSREAQAEMTGISPEGVRKNQYRLRTKMGFASQPELEQFIGSFKKQT